MRKVKHWHLDELHLPLKVNWKIARGSVQEKINLLVTFKEGSFSGRGEVAFLTHGGLTAESVKKSFQEFCEFAPPDLNGLDHLTEILESATEEMNLPPNLRFALEAAYVEFLSKLMEDQVPRVLGVRDVHNIATSYSLPHMDPTEVGEFMNTHDLSRFPFLKIKVIGEEDIDLVREIAKEFSGPLRIDGNEGFTDASEALRFCEELKGLNIEFLEQPISHKNFDECVRLREKSPILLMADESLQDRAVVDDFQKAFHGVNVKLQKAGGYIKALRQLREARQLGLKTMLGCMIETSLGISCALNIAHGVDFYDLDGFLHLKEDPFNLVYEDKGLILNSHSQ